jgi:hypothetical protein
MGSVEEKIKTGGLVNGAQTNLLEEMKLLKEFQDQSGLFHVTKIFISYKSLTFSNRFRLWVEMIR